MGFMSRVTYEMYQGVKAPPNFMPWNFGKRALPFSSNSVEVLYTSHVLEHFPRWKAQEIVKETFRVLKPGGLIRVIVPDLEVLCRRYLLTFGLPIDNLTPAQRAPLDATAFNLLFYTKDHVTSTKASLDMRIAGLFPHMYNYDFLDLSKLLSTAGFSSVERLTYRTGRCPDIEKLDNNPDVSLYVEAEKSSASLH